jgi:hypothetical protein
MLSKNNKYTDDKVIRTALKKKLIFEHTQDPKLRIVEELGVSHGEARVDMAVINGVIHGYEIKSDLDTLYRLPEQMNFYNSVFTEMTLVVGKNHLFDAINLVPEWWGIVIAKFNADGVIEFNSIRESEKNLNQNGVCIAKLLWKDEALDILEQVGKAKGLRSKPRSYIYQKLSDVFDKQTLEDKVRDKLFFREAWKVDAPLMLNGD